MPTSHAAPDIRELRDASLPRGGFPAARSADFRVFFEPDVHKRIWQHATEDTSVEVGGVLVGSWEQDDDGPFVAVRAVIRCDSAVSKTAEVTFTHEVWAKINEEMDSKYADARIVGWYHTHPDFGIFLSERDGFIHQHFFSSPGQIAFVVDPIRGTEGVFAWSSGKTELCSHYWIGDRIVAETDKQREDRPAPETFVGKRTDLPSTDHVSKSAPNRVLSYSTLFGFLAVFLLGYLIAGMRSSSEARRLAEGAVAHYGIWKGLRPDLDKNLHAVDRELAVLWKEIKRLSAEHVELAGDEAGEKKKDYLVVLGRIRRLRRALDLIEDTYCLTPTEALQQERISQRLLMLAVSSPNSKNWATDI